jgi:hypothetical protein
LELISELDGVRGVWMDNSISHPFGGQSRNIVAINVSVAQAGNCRDGNNARAWLTSQTCWFRDRNALLFLAWRAGAQVKWHGPKRFTQPRKASPAAATNPGPARRWASPSHVGSPLFLHVRWIRTRAWAIWRPPPSSTPAVELINHQGHSRTALFTNLIKEGDGVINLPRSSYHVVLRVVLVVYHANTALMLHPRAPTYVIPRTLYMEFTTLVLILLFFFSFSFVISAVNFHTPSDPKYFGESIHISCH